MAIFAARRRSIAGRYLTAGVAAFVFAALSVQAEAVTYGPAPYVGDGASGFHAITPQRLISISLPADTTVTIPVTGHATLPGSGVDDVALAATVTRAQKAGSLFVWAKNHARPNQATARYRGNVATTTTILSRIGKTSIRVRSTERMRLRLDVTGWYDRFSFLQFDPLAGLQYHSVTPTRLLSAAISAGGRASVAIAGQAGVPSASNAPVAAVYLTATNATGPGHVTVGGARVLSFLGGGAATTLALLPLNTDGILTLRLHASGARLVVAVAGYYGKAQNDIITGQSSLIPSVSLFDARLSANATRSVSAVGAGRLPPAGVESVFLRVTVTRASGRGRLAFHGAGLAEPPTRSVSYRRGRSTAFAVAEVDLQSGAFTFTKRGAAATVKLRAVGWNAIVIPPPPIVPGPPPDPGFSTSSSTAKAARSSDPKRPLLPTSVTTATKLGGVSPERTVIRQDPRAAVRAWTDEELADAKPIPLAGGASSSNTFDDPNINYPAYDSYTSDYLPTASYDNRVGRVYFRDILSQLSGFCSGTVVARNLVITAAHCFVNTGFGATDIVFAAGNHGFNADSLWGASVVDYWTYYETNGTPSEINSEDRFEPLDFAVIVIAPENGTHIGTRLGWHGIKASYVNAPVYQIGYPSEGWWERNGRCGDNFCDAYYQRSPLADYYSPASGWWEQMFGGWTNGGASGGPIFQYVAGTGWRLTSVVSHGDNTIVTCADAGQNCDGRYYGRNTWVPVFNNWILSLYSKWAIN